MLTASILLALFIGWIMGGRVTRLSDFQLAFPWVIIAALLLQSVLPHLASGPLAGFRFIFLVISYLLLIWALSRNEPSPGIILATAGVFFNFLVIIFNGGMPVSPGAIRAIGYSGSLSTLIAVKDGVHVLMASTTRLPWLADIIPEPLPSPFRGVASPGDVLLAAGVFAIVLSKMMYVGRRRKIGSDAG